MSLFYIGQRVRIIASENFPEVVGREFVVIDLTNDANQGEHLPPAPGVVVRHNGGRIRGPYWAFEPILPPGLESLEEINALYEPSPTEVRT